MRDYIRHCEDPWFSELELRQKVLREKGAWDTLDNAISRLEEQAKARQAEVLRKQQADIANRQSVIDEIPLMEDIAMEAESLALSGLPLPEIATQLGGRATVGQLKNHFENNPISA